MAVDAEDNVWITAANSATVMKISPEGKLLLTIGTRGRRGDWDEASQRLLWQPVMVAFAPNGDVYIGEGHANESPNDAESDDPANNIGAARIIHLDKNGKFIKQWFGNEVGQESSVRPTDSPSIPRREMSGSAIARNIASSSTRRWHVHQDHPDEKSRVRDLFRFAR